MHTAHTQTILYRLATEHLPLTCARLHASTPSVHSTMCRRRILSWLGLRTPFTTGVYYSDSTATETGFFPSENETMYPCHDVTYLRYVYWVCNGHGIGNKNRMWLHVRVLYMRWEYFGTSLLWDETIIGNLYPRAMRWELYEPTIIGNLYHAP